MKYTIISYNNEQNYHVCKNEKGQRENLDLVTDATSPECDNDMFYDGSLIGKEVEIEETFPYISFGRNIKFI